MMETIESLSEKVKVFQETTYKLAATIADLSTTQKEIIRNCSAMDAKLQVLQEELLELKKAQPKQP